MKHCERGAAQGWLMRVIHPMKKALTNTWLSPWGQAATVLFPLVPLNNAVTFHGGSQARSKDILLLPPQLIKRATVSTFKIQCY